MPKQHDIQIKKKYSQNFLREQWVIDSMLNNVTLTPSTSVFEIGGGSGFLTQSILKQDIARLWVFEIDPEWADHLKSTFTLRQAQGDRVLEVKEQNILDTDFSLFESNKPWTLLSNLPYQITFPILHLLQKNMHLLKEGVIMVQEEVGQKLLKTGGRDYGFSSIYFQYYFDWKMLDKIPPTAFYPAPKVFSRLLYFKPNFNRVEIPQEELFWKFIKVAFKQPRRTLKNNLNGTHYNLSKISEETLALRAQQLDMHDLLEIWGKII
jgi:16S rRNA (adenine1518-N6/adenine1519-N6)-dimethyltransferase